jgi:hypothetical protein
MLFGLPVCYAPESAETLSKRWIIRPSRSNTEAYLMFTRYQRGRQIPTSKSSAVTLEFTIEAVVVQGKKWNENRFLYLAKMRKDCPCQILLVDTAPSCIVSVPSEVTH